MLTEKIVLGPRPKLKKINDLQTEQGINCVVTLLSEREEARKIGQATKKAGLEWLWFPMAGGNPDKLDPSELREQTAAFAQRLAADDGSKFYVHCSAGIHRTGMFCYGSLLQAGCTRDEAKAALQKLRDVTGENVGDHRLDFIDGVLTRD